MGDIGAFGKTPSAPAASVSAYSQTQAPFLEPVKADKTLVEPSKKKDTAEISDAARAQLAADRRQDQTYAAQQAESQNQTAITG